MYKMSKSFDEIGIQDDFMFGTVMRKPELCKPFLEIVLGISISRIEYPEIQKNIDVTLKAKSVRLDVYVNDEKGTVYNVEMQTSRKRNLPKRSRYYQGIIDLDLIRKGQDYDELPIGIVIFVCTFDLFGLGLPVYRFENRCVDNPELSLGDGTIKIVLNTKGVKDGISPELRELLRYIDEGSVSNAYTESLEKEVKLVRTDAEWRHEYMTLDMWMKEKVKDAVVEGREQGLEQGRAEGRAEGHEKGLLEGQLIGVFSLFGKGKISIEDALEECGLQENEFIEKFNEWKKAN